MIRMIHLTLMQFFCISNSTCKCLVKKTYNHNKVLEKSSGIVCYYYVSLSCNISRATVCDRISNVGGVYHILLECLHFRGKKMSSNIFKDYKRHSL